MYLRTDIIIASSFFLLALVYSYYHRHRFCRRARQKTMSCLLSGILKVGSNRTAARRMMGAPRLDQAVNGDRRHVAVVAASTLRNRSKLRLEACAVQRHIHFAPAACRLGPLPHQRPNWHPVIQIPLWVPDWVGARNPTMPHPRVRATDEEKYRQLLSKSGNSGALLAARRPNCQLQRCGRGGAPFRWGEVEVAELDEAALAPVARFAKLL